MENYLATVSEDVGHKRSLVLFLSITDPDKLKPSKFLDHEIHLIKNHDLQICIEKNPGKNM